MLLQGKALVTVDLWTTPADAEAASAGDAEEQLVHAGEGPGEGEDWCAPQFLVIAEVVVEVAESGDVSVVELRMTLPRSSVEQMLLGMVDGETNIVLRELSPVQPAANGRASALDQQWEDILALLGNSLKNGFCERNNLNSTSAEAEPAPQARGGKEDTKKREEKKKEVLMSDKKIQLSRGAAIALLIIVLAMGGALAALVSAWIGHPVLAAGSTVPVYVARPVAASTAAVPNPAAVRAGFASVVKPALPAVVNISSSRVVRTQNSPMAPFLNDPFFRQFFGNQQNVPRERRERSLGSGVIVSPKGYILTNNHVVDGATDITVALSDKREFKGTVVGRDPKTDVAIVKIDATNLPTLTLGDSSKLQVGDYVLAIGDPFGVGETVTQGIVSATGRAGLDIEGYENFIQTDAAINPGNSGGALIDANGDLVGINTAILSSAGGNQGIGFAIPINQARNVMDQILKNGKVVRGWLGVSIQDVTPAIAKAFKVPETSGALVSDVNSKGPSAGSGIKQGDVIVGLNGKPVSGPNDLRLRIAEMAPGSAAHLQVISNGQSHEVTVKLGELPEKPAVASAKQGTETGPLAGVQVEGLTSDTARQLNLPAETKGVVVESVQANSAAAEAGVQRGDVIQEINRKPVNSVGDYEQALKQSGDKQSVVLLDNRSGTRIFVVVNPNG